MNDIEEKVLNKILLYCIKKSDSHFELKELLMESNCIRVKGSNLFKKPSDLLDEKCRVASLYTVDDNVFPDSSLATDIILPYLHSLGLRQDISLTDLIERSETVSRLPSDEADHRVVKILGEVRNLFSKADKFSKANKSLIAEFKQVEFLPILPKPNDFIYPWKASCISKTRGSIAEIHLEDSKMLVGSTCLILDEKMSEINFATKKYLGLFDKEININDVLDQLDIISKFKENNPNAKPKNIEDHCRLIYKHLDSTCKKNDASKSLIGGRLTNTNFIFVEGVFMNPSKVSFTYEAVKYGNLLPHLAILPSWYNDFSSLMGAVCLKYKFNEQQLLEAMDAINEARKPNDIDLILRLVNWLADTIMRNKTNLNEIGNVLVPNENGILMLNNDVCFNDCHWIEEDSFDYLHPQISRPISEALGVISKREFTVKCLGEPIAFSQEEKLTNRIKSILEGYPADETILKEFVQNADDAGASEIHFILDTRTLESDTVFEKRYADLQGPALCIYNNASFTEKDIAGIQCLGSGSKRLDDMKIGQYGVGFNSIYHLTDAPSFLSKGENPKETLCIMDPNQKYVSSHSQKGMRFKDVSQLRNHFPDVIKGYLEDLEDEYRGDKFTMFRFPLRNEIMAQNSEISENVITIPKIDDLFIKFQSVVFEIMLFVKSVSKIVLKKIDSDGKIIRVYEASSRSSNDDMQNRKAFAENVEEISKSLRNREIQLQNVKYQDVQYKLILSDSNHNEEKWLVCQSIGFDSPTNIPPSINSAFQEGKSLIPCGGVAVSPQKKGKKHRLYCYLPLPKETASHASLPVHVNGHFALDDKRRYLVNDSGYRTDWNNLLMTEVIAPCYTAIIRRTFDNVRTRPSIDAITHGYSTFPRIIKDESYVSVLAKAVYKQVCEKQLKVFVVLQQDIKSSRWFNIQQNIDALAVFDNLSSQLCSSDSINSQGSENTEKVKNLRDSMKNTGYNLIWHEIPLFVLEGFQAITTCLKFISPASVFDFFRTFKINADCKLQRIPCPLSESAIKNIKKLESIIKYCKKYDNFFEELPGLPLCLTKDLMLREFSSSSPVIVSDFYDLFSKSSSRFFNPTVQKIFRVDLAKKSPVFALMTMHDVSNFLLKEIDEKLKQDSRIKWNPSVPSSSNELSLVWIKHFWELIDSLFKPEHRDKLQFSNDFKKIENWCLIPAKDTSGIYLYPIKASKAVENASDDLLISNLVNILRELKIPHLLPEVHVNISTRKQTSVFNLCTSLLNPVDVLKALDDMTKYHDLAYLMSSIRESSREALLQYFGKHFANNVGDVTTEVLETLKKLPLHKTVTGEYIDLKDAEMVYLIPQGVPIDGMDTWKNPNGPIKFLYRSIGDIDELYKYLGCTLYTEVEMYLQLIFNPSTRCVEFSEKELYVYIRYLKDKLMHSLEGDIKKLIISKLSNFAFIPDSNGYLCKASQFYDQTHPLFKEFERSFLPKPYNDRDWNSFLRKIGLRHKVTNDNLVGYAAQLNRETSTYDVHRSSSTVLKCNLIWDEICNRNDLSDQQLLQLSHFSIVPQKTVSDRALLEIHQRFNSQLRFAPYSGCVASYHFNKVWSSAHLIYYNLRDLKVQEYKNKLGIQSTPSVRNVTEHCKNLCRRLNKPENFNITEKRLDLIVDVMKNIYQFLMVYASTDELEDLVKIPFLFIKESCVFVKTTQVVLEMTSLFEIRPYLFRFPLCFGDCADLFNRLGVQTSVTPVHYVNLLEIIKEEYGEKRIDDPNKKRAAVQAIKFLFHETYRGMLKETLKLQNRALYLLSKKGKLVDSRDLVFIDNILHSDRVGAIEKPILDEILIQKTPNTFEKVLTFFHMEYLPDHMRPTMLSSLIVERLDAQCKANILDDSSGFVFDMNERVKAPEFQLGLLRLIKTDCSKKRRAEYDHDKWKGKLEKYLNSLTFYSLDVIKTHLLYRNEVLPDSNSIIRSIFSEGGTNNEPMKTYLKHTYYTNYEGFALTDVSREICNFLGLYFHSDLDGRPIVTKILRCDLDEIHRMLDGERVEKLDCEIVVEERTLPPPGMAIPAADYHLLKKDFAIFAVNDYVGYQVVDQPGDTFYVYAIIRLIETVECDDRDAETEAQNMISKDYCIDIGSEEGLKMVKACKLFKFVDSDLISDNVDAGSGNEWDPVSEKMKISATLEAAIMGNDVGLKETVRRRLMECWIDNEDFLSHIRDEVVRLERKKLQAAGGESCNNSNDIDVDSFDDAFEVERNFLQKRYSENCAQRKIYEDRLRRNAATNAATEASMSAMIESQNNQNSPNRPTTSQSRSSAACSMPEFSCGRNPQPAQAKCWFRQAKANFNAGTQEKSHEWAILKYHEASVSGLKAAQFSISSSSFKTHNLRSMLECLDAELSSLKPFAQRVISLMGAVASSTSSNPMDILCPKVEYIPMLPNDNLSERKVLEIKAATENLLDEVEEFI